MLYHIVFIFYVLSFVYCVCDSTFSGNVTDERTKYITIDFAVVSSFKAIRCCIKDSHTIIWDFKQTGNSRWQPIINVKRNMYSSNQPLLTKRNQTIQIRSIGLNNDGIYRCRALNKNQIIAEHSTNITVYSCVNREKPEIFPPKSQYGHGGSIAIFTCTGDFGCTPDISATVSWYSHANNEKWSKLPNNNNFPRYNVTVLKRNKDTIIESKLILTGLTRDDFSRKFACYVTSQHGNRSFPVHLLKKSIRVSRSLSKEQVWTIVCTCVIVVVAVFIIRTRFYNIKFLIFSYLPIFGLKDMDGCKYHAFILHDDNEDDQTLATLISNRLEKDSYSVRMSSSDDECGLEMNRIEKSVEDCRSLIIIYPTDVPKEPRNSHFVRHCGVQQYFSTKLITVIKRHSQRRHGGHVLDDDALTKLLFPDSQHSCSYQFNKFYCELRLRLPKADRSRKKLTPEQETLNA